MPVNKITIGNYQLQISFKFLEEAQVVLEVVAEVLDLPFEHGDTLHSHSECKTAVLPAVDAGSLQNVRVHHSAAHDFQPACTLADVAALSVADVAAHVNLG